MRYVAILKIVPENSEELKGALIKEGLRELANELAEYLQYANESAVKNDIVFKVNL